MNDFTPFQLEYYNSHARPFASWPKHFLVWLIQPLFCALFVSQLFHEYYNATQNWLYFFALCLVIFNAVGACAITVIYWALCIASWTESLTLEVNEDKVELKNKTQTMRLKLMPLVLVKKNIVFYLDIATDIIMSAAFVSVGYPFLGMSYAAIIVWQHFVLNKSNKEMLKFIATLEDPFEDAEKENIDDLANKLFHGE